MSERISWETCPDCGGLVAVGWQPRTEQRTASLWEQPVEADCLNGCMLTPGQLQVFAVYPGAGPGR
jgi:hypothetical protein